MQASLHQWYTADEGIAAFGDAASAKLLCDGQFAVLPTAVLCLTTLGDPATQPYMLFPSSVMWKPARPDYDPADKIPWLPTKAREPRGADGGKIREHHLFLRAPGDERFVYAGGAHLGSWGDNQKPNCKEAGFSLAVKLPHDIWLHLGGYAGWRVELDHHKDQFLDHGDVAAFQRLIEELARHNSAHLYLTRYEEDSLTIYFNARRGWLSYQSSPRDFGMHTCDLDCSGEPGTEELFLCTCGIDLEVPAEQTVPREL